MAGWIKLYRQILDKPIFQNEKLLKTFIWCLLKASHKSFEQLVGRQKVLLQSGQFVTGRHKAAQELGMPPSTAWGYLKLLEANSSIDIKSNNKYSVVTVVNWASFQSEDNISDSKLDSTLDNKWTTNGQQMDTNKNLKNGKNGKKKEEDTASAVDAHKVMAEYNRIFGEFYKRSLSLTPGRLKKIQARLNTYSVDDLVTAMEHLRGSAWHCGTDKKNTTFYATVDFIFRNDEKVDEWLKKEPPRAANSYGGAIGGTKSIYDDLEMYRLPKGEGLENEQH